MYIQDRDSKNFKTGNGRKNMPNGEGVRRLARGSGVSASSPSRVQCHGLSSPPALFCR